MLKDFRELLERNETLDEDQVRETADMLLQRCFIYADDHGQRRHYETVTRYRSYFDNLFNAFGYELIVNHQELMAGIRSTRTPRFLMRTDQTLLLLILRLIYHDRVKAAEQDERMRILVRAEDIFGIYDERTGRKRPTQRAGREMLGEFQRRGLCRIGDDLEDQDFEVELRPALYHVTPESAVAALEEFVRAAQRQEGDRNV